MRIPRAHAYCNCVKRVREGGETRRLETKDGGRGVEIDGCTRRVGRDVDARKDERKRDRESRVA